jgi:hypothetical protein
MRSTSKACATIIVIRYTTFPSPKETSFYDSRKKATTIQNGHDKDPTLSLRWYQVEPTTSRMSRTSSPTLTHGMSLNSDASTRRTFFIASILSQTYTIYKAKLSSIKSCTLLTFPNTRGPFTFITPDTRGLCQLFLPFRLSTLCDQQQVRNNPSSWQSLNLEPLKTLAQLNPNWQASKALKTNGVRLTKRPRICY